MKRDFDQIRARILDVQEATVRSIGIAGTHDSFSALFECVLMLHDRLSMVENELCRHIEQSAPHTPGGTNG